jgi:CRISPR-associated protein Cas5d
MERLFDVRVGGEYACFTRPEFKGERVSYPVMTPSAARGLLEAIFWKPEIRWQVREIWVLKPVRQITIMRNEIGDRQSGRPFVAEERRQQRMSLVLKDVEYVVKGALMTQPHANKSLGVYADMVERRLARGQCHHTPCLGTREFPAWFEPARGDEVPFALDMGVGAMLFDIAYYESDARPEITFCRHGPEGRRVAQGYAEALFFPAEITGGTLIVQPALYQALYERGRGHASRAR